uniref:BRO1 domain-containing protein n=1 Tax=Knipowitschia caucasica TaxID=637954 RepID=A0AAV2MDU0_KNICA
MCSPLFPRSESQTRSGVAHNPNHILHRPDQAHHLHVSSMEITPQDNFHHYSTHAPLLSPTSPLIYSGIPYFSHPPIFPPHSTSQNLFDSIDESTASHPFRSDGPRFSRLYRSPFMTPLYLIVHRFSPASSLEISPRDHTSVSPSTFIAFAPSDRGSSRPRTHPDYPRDSLRISTLTSKLSQTLTTNPHTTTSQEPWIQVLSLPQLAPTSHIRLPRLTPTRRRTSSQPSPAIFPVRAAPTPLSHPSSRTVVPSPLPSFHSILRPSKRLKPPFSSSKPPPPSDSPASYSDIQQALPTTSIIVSPYFRTSPHPPLRTTLNQRFLTKKPPSLLSHIAPEPSSPPLPASSSEPDPLALLLRSTITPKLTTPYSPSRNLNLPGKIYERPNTRIPSPRTSPAYGREEAREPRESPPTTANMEAVPRMPMIWLDLKEAGDFQLSPSVKQFILKNYGENPDNYNEQLKKLESLRQSAVNVTRDFEGCSTLRKYFGQLHYLQSRVPMGPGQEAAVPISWTEIFSGKSVTHEDISYEQACILYNLGALHSMLGAMDNRVSEEGMKVSCTHFQCSAGAFSYLRDHFSNNYSVDMSHQILNLNINLMLGQAQECLLEKSMLDNRKSFLVARISAQVRGGEGGCGGPGDVGVMWSAVGVPVMWGDVVSCGGPGDVGGMWSAVGVRGMWSAVGVRGMWG